MSVDGHDRPTSRRTASFTPALLDGVDCPRIRGRRTRWWPVVPTDLAVTALVVLFGVAFTHSLGEVPASLWQVGVVPLVAWGVTRFVRRSRPDHLEMALPEELIVAGVSWVVWTTPCQMVSTFDGVSVMASWAMMTGASLLVSLSGWR